MIILTRNTTKFSKRQQTIGTKKFIVHFLTVCANTDADREGEKTIEELSIVEIQPKIVPFQK